jgi:hypothetical protein
MSDALLDVLWLPSLDYDVAALDYTARLAGVPLGRQLGRVYHTLQGGVTGMEWRWIALAPAGPLQGRAPSRREAMLEVETRALPTAPAPG